MSLRIGSYRTRRPAAARGLLWAPITEADSLKPSSTVEVHITEKISYSLLDPLRKTRNSRLDENGSLPPRARMFAPLTSPLENLVPYTPYTTLVSPRVSTHLNPKLASSPDSWKLEEADVANVDSNRSSTSSSGTVMGPSRMDLRLATSTDLEIVDFLSNQQSDVATTTNFKHAKQEAEQRKASILVFDVFVTENRTLRAYGIGTSPDKPIYIYYPLRHPYDEAFLETLGNRNTLSYDFPSIPDEALGLDEKETTGLAKLKTAFGPSLKRRCTSVSNPVLTLPLSQSLLQFYNPLAGYRPETVSGLRWSSLWINHRFRTCLQKPEETTVAGILPTEEELDAMAARNIKVACYEARKARMSRVQRWISKIVHEKRMLKGLKVTGGLTEDDRRRLAQPDVLRKTEDAGAVFLSPDVTVPDDPRLAKFIIPALVQNANTGQTAMPSLSSKSVKGPRNSTESKEKSGDRTSGKEMGTTTKTKEEQTADIGLPKKHPITNREPDSLSFSRRPATVYDLYQLAEENNVNFTPEMAIEPERPTEFVFADEYDAIASNGKSESDTTKTGIQIYYEPPVAQTKEEKKQSNVSYVSGKYMWVHERISWVVVYERHKLSTAWIKAEKEKMKAAAKKELAKTKSMPNIKQKEKEAEMLKQETPAQVAKTVARVKLYPPATSGRDMLAYIDFETGQLSIRKDIALEDLHLAVLAMFSVVNIEEAIYKEKMLQKKLQVRRNIAALLCLPAAEGQEKIPSEVESTSDKRSSTSSTTNCQPQNEAQQTAIEEEEAEEESSDGEDSVQEMVRKTPTGWVTVRRDHIEENYGKKDPPRVPVLSNSFTEWSITTEETTNPTDAEYEDLDGDGDGS